VFVYDMSVHSDNKVMVSSRYGSRRNPAWNCVPCSLLSLLFTWSSKSDLMTHLIGSVMHGRSFECQFRKADVNWKYCAWGAVTSLNWA